MFRAVGAALVAAALAGCGSAPSGVPVRGGLDELLATTVARERAEGTSRFTGDTSVVVGTTETYRFAARGAERLSPAGPSVDISSVTVDHPGAPPASSHLIVRPDGIYADEPTPGAPPAARPWVRLDSAYRNPLTGADYSDAVALQHQSGTRTFCFTELGPASLAGGSPDVQDGVPVIRYALHIDLTRPGVDRRTADQFRTLGLASLDTLMYVDALDRVLRCSLDQPLPGGGHVASDELFRDFGAPLDVPAPPPDQVAN